MKKCFIFILFWLLAGFWLPFAQATTVTSNLGLIQPDDHSFGWGAVWRYNNSLLDILCVRGDNSTVSDGQLMLFSGTGGHIARHATQTGVPVLSSGVLSTIAAPPASGTAIVKGDGSGGFAAASSGIDYAPASSMPAGAVMQYIGESAPSGWFICNGSTVSRTTYSALFAAECPIKGTFTITIGASAVGSLTAHGRVTGDQVYFTTTGALPSPLSAGNTLYYIIRLTDNTFNVATSRANAFNNVAITTSGTQSGVHTLVSCPWGLGNGSSIFNLPDLRGRFPLMEGASSAADNTTNIGYSSSGTGPTGSADSGNAHNNMPPYAVINFIIHY